MSKIIKEGNIPKLKVECAICGCKFEVDYRDLFSREGSDYKNYVLCPCCNFGTHLSKIGVDFLTLYKTDSGDVVELNKSIIQY